MDDLTFAFFIQVQLEGMRDLRQRSMDEKTQVTVLDSEVAHSDYERKLEKLQKIIYDRGLDQYNSSAVKINAAVTTNHQQVPEKLSTVEFDHQTDHNTTPATTIDTGVFTKLTEENNTIGDHPAASSLSDVNHSIKSAHTDADAAGELLQRLLNITNQVINSSRLKTESESSPRSNTGTEKLRCVSCLEDKHPADVTQAPCEHLYCRDCIVQLFEASKTDESLYPPCCCNKVILFSYVKDFMQDDFIRECVLKWIEWSTPQSTYCAEPTCSTFIPDWQTSRSIGVCSSCQKSTCTICKEENHAGECATSMTNQTLLALATEMGWTRCFFCSRMVELETGCNHVTYVYTFCPFRTSGSVLMSNHTVAAAENSSVTPADSSGRRARVPYGTRTAPSSLDSATRDVGAWPGSQHAQRFNR